MLQKKKNQQNHGPAVYLQDLANKIKKQMSLFPLNSLGNPTIQKKQDMKKSQTSRYLLFLEKLFYARNNI